MVVFQGLRLAIVGVAIGLGRRVPPQQSPVVVPVRRNGARSARLHRGAIRPHGRRAVGGLAARAARKSRRSHTGVEVPSRIAALKRSTGRREEWRSTLIKILIIEDPPSSHPPVDLFSLATTRLSQLTSVGRPAHELSYLTKSITLGNAKCPATVSMTLIWQVYKPGVNASGGTSNWNSAAWRSGTSIVVRSTTGVS